MPCAPCVLNIHASALVPLLPYDFSVAWAPLRHCRWAHRLPAHLSVSRLTALMLQAGLHNSARPAAGLPAF